MSTLSTSQSLHSSASVETHASTDVDSGLSSVAGNDCLIHGKCLVDSYEQIEEHLCTHDVVKKHTSDYDSIAFWMSTVCHLFDDESDELPCASTSSSCSRVHSEPEADISPNVLSLFESVPATKNTIFRNDEVVSSEHAFRLEEIECRMARGITPPKADQKNNRKWKLTPMNKREIPCQAFVAKYILEHVPESCMSFNFFNYHKALLFWGDMAAKGVTETYPFSNKADAHPVVHPNGQNITDDTLKRCFDAKLCCDRFDA